MFCKSLENVFKDCVKKTRLDFEQKGLTLCIFFGVKLCHTRDIKGFKSQSSHFSQKNGVDRLEEIRKIFPVSSFSIWAMIYTEQTVRSGQAC